MVTVTVTVTVTGTVASLRGHLRVRRSLSHWQAHWQLAVTRPGTDSARTQFDQALAYLNGCPESNALTAAASESTPRAGRPLAFNSYCCCGPPPASSCPPAPRPLRLSRSQPCWLMPRKIGSLCPAASCPDSESSVPADCHMPSESSVPADCHMPSRL